MRSVVRVVAWLIVFAGAAGVGAYIAAHSDPFTPSVEGGSPSGQVVSPTPSSPGAGHAVWKGTITSATFHQLHVGGRCSSDWRGSMTLAIDDAGVVQGRATLRRAGRLRCDFATAQSQIARLEVSVTGQVAAGGFALHLQEVSSIPAEGAADYGGFVSTLLQPDARPFLVIGDDAAGAQGVLVIRRPDKEELGTYVSTTRVRMGCIRGCPA
jgi:hypothetical protein